MAEALLRRLAGTESGWRVVSAGLAAGRGLPASDHAVQILQEDGVNLSRHRSQPVSADLVEQSTCIIAMTRDHLSALQRKFPEAAGRMWLLREWDPEVRHGALDLMDPIGGGLEAYARCRDVIKRTLPRLFSFIRNQDAPKPMPAPTDSATTTRLAFACDPSSTTEANALASRLRAEGHSLLDLCPIEGAEAGLAEAAARVGRQVASGAAPMGLLTGHHPAALAIAANRLPGIRAVEVRGEAEAAAARRDLDANVLCLPSAIPADEAVTLVRVFLETPALAEAAATVRDLSSVGGDGITRIEATDPAVAAAIHDEEKRQFDNIELIASENFTSRAVREAQGSALTNKYAEGYPGRRWYGGCEHVDVVESLAIERAKRLFGAEHANVQPHSGSQANMAVYFSVLQPGDRILTMNLAHGGHLTHGHKANFSGRLYEVHHYGVEAQSGCIDYEALARQAEEVRPRMITAGASAYPRLLDFARMREIADAVGAYLFVDMAHIAGLVAGGVHPNPVPYADFVTSTTHKSLRGPRSGLVLCREQFAKGVDSQTFPGVQGGPLMHVIAAKAVCFHEALQPAFRDYARQITLNARALAARLSMLGYTLVSGGTDNHVMLVDLRPAGLNGKQAQEALDEAGITVNKNAIPFDTEPISKTGGIRIGTPAMTTRGMKEEAMMEIADFIHAALRRVDDRAALHRLREEVHAFTSRYPIP